MSQIFRVHPDSPQSRLIKQAADIIRKGGVAIYPTDGAYAIGCAMGDKRALDRIVQIRRLDNKHNFTLLCRDLSELASYARVDNIAYRLLKHNTPGPYTFILRATLEVPRRLMHPKKKTIGLRVPDNAIVLALLEELNEPMMTATLQMPGDEYPMTDPEEMVQFMGKQVDLVIDGGWGEMVCTTVINMTEDIPQVIREGKGDPTPFMP